jgi:uncharacterized protein YxjI
MARVLSIANKLLSIRGQMDITDEQGHQVYEAKGELALLSPTWRIRGGSTELARIRKKIFCLAPTWEVEGMAGDFHVKRKIFSWTRKYYVVGSDLHGAVIKGGLFDLSFEILKDQHTIARASGKILSLRDRHNVEILGKEELFVVIAMVILHLDRKDDRSSNDD